MRRAPLLILHRAVDEENSLQTPQADYFAAYHHLKLSRDDKGVLIAEFHSDGGSFIMNAQAHTEFVDAFHRIGQDRANKIVIITGASVNFIGDVEWQSFGDVADLSKSTTGRGKFDPALFRVPYD